ncbi:uncharacterized protein SPPG_00414 [Spizellomyces punctatus DAOM BR117]|uniref:Uncharacterized protein n=1 Tax=Spizellomyces punctatus (strain DAOM BR117) TaxID=645134 RepID=A0A0L0HUY2_SPIPD|nr:uncharacterized protein SPPG_00414 [Spizellomyces punctatus DAOM BR117]KND04705.1 hypothetical protein SPPG_00414 [Spizellomyces punctatus DAOM BR117]|eukprot:XP_016612744.1 hypothetical protein SPPG_00414 [Spizellomyces punctatus DAOM BR117]
MSTRDVLALIASDLKASTSDLLLETPPRIDASKTFSTLHNYITHHPVSPPTFHSSADKLATELVSLYRSTFAPKDTQSHRGVYRLDLEQVAGEDTKLLVLVAWLQKLLPIYDPSRFIADWWESFMKPVLTAGRWKPLVDRVTNITVELLSYEHWSWAQNMGNLPGIEQFRRAIVGSYLAERALVWERGQTSSKEYGPGGVTPLAISERANRKIGAFWDTVCANNLERVLMQFGVARPKDFFDLLNEYCVNKQHRMHVLVFLIKFGRREEAPLYYIHESKLFHTILSSAMKDTNPGIICSIVTFLTVLMPSIVGRLVDTLNDLLAILLRLVYWESTYSIVLNLTSKRSHQVTHRSEIEEPQVAVDTILTEYTHVAIAESIENYFTLLYGIFPCNTVEFLRAFYEVKRPDFQWRDQSGVLSGTFELADDPFMEMRKQVDEMEDMDLNDIVVKKLMTLSKSHRLHQNLLFLTSQKEREMSKLVQKDPSDVIIESLELRSYSGLQAAANDNKPSAVSIHSVEEGNEESIRRFTILDHTEHVAPILSPVPKLKDRGSESILDVNAVKSTLQGDGASTASAEVRQPTSSRETEDAVPGVSAEPEGRPIGPQKKVKTVAQGDVGEAGVDLNAILNINRILRTTIIGYKDSLATLPTCTPEQCLTPSHVDILKLQLLLLLNDINFQFYLRYHHIQFIRKLRKDHIQEEVKEADRQSVFEKLKIQNQEISLLHDNLNRQRQEASSIRERQRKYEEELSRRLRVAKEEAVLLKAEVARLKDGIRKGDMEMDELRKSAGDADARIFQLQTEIDVTAPDLERLKECEETIEALSKRVLAREGTEAQAELWSREKDQLVDRVVGLQMQLADADREVEKLQAEIQTHVQTAGQACIRANQLELQMEKLEKDAKELGSTVQLLQTSNSERIKAIEAKYETIKRVNLQLQGRIASLLMTSELRQPATFLEQEVALPVTIGRYD